MSESAAALLESLIVNFELNRIFPYTSPMKNVPARERVIIPRVLRQVRIFLLLLESSQRLCFLQSLSDQNSASTRGLRRRETELRGGEVEHPYMFFLPKALYAVGQIPTGKCGSVFSLLHGLFPGRSRVAASCLNSALRSLLNGEYE